MTHSAQEPVLYGLVAQFETPEALIKAARGARIAGYRMMDAYTPFAVQGLASALGLPKSPLPLIVLLAGLMGAGSGFALQTYGMVFDYPWIVAGRPLFSWPAFIPITFELGVLVAAVTGVVSLFVLLRLPRPYHPIFNAPRFRRASVDGFFLCIEAADPQFDAEKTRQFLTQFQPQQISDVHC
jgi:hypothetical protein